MSEVKLEVVETNVLVVQKLSIEEIKSKINELNEKYESLVIPNDLEELDELKKTLSEEMKYIESSRKEFYKKIEEDKKLVMSVEKTIKSVLNNIKEQVEYLLREEKEKRYNDCLGFYNEQLEQREVFDFIDFKEHIFEETMVNSNIYTTKGELTKRIKDIIINKLDKFASDKILIGDDLAILNKYKNNGFDLAQAKLEVEELRDLERKNKQLEEEKEKLEQEKLKEQAEQKIKQETKEEITIEKAQPVEKVEEDNFDYVAIKIEKTRIPNFIKMLEKSNVEYKKITKGDYNE